VEGWDVQPQFWKGIRSEGSEGNEIWAVRQHAPYQVACDTNAPLVTRRDECGYLTALETMSTTESPMANNFLTDPVTPRWTRDLIRFLPVKSQFILSNNVRDRHPFPVEQGKYVPLPLTQYLTEALKLKGYRRFITFNLIHGFRPVIPRGEVESEINDFFQREFKLKFDGPRPSLEKSLETIEQLAGYGGEFIVIFADFASRYAVRTDSLTEKEHEYFTRALMLSHSTLPHNTAAVKEAQFNPVIWICDQENDLPGWFTLNNPRVRSIVIPRPDHIIRGALIQTLTPSLPGFAEASAEDKAEKHSVFIEQTEGMFLTDVIAITQLCRREQLSFDDIGEAVRRYKLGVTEDPWKRLDRAKIVNGEPFIRRRVKGQQPAVVKALDIIKRAATGLSGAQGSRTGGKPRGVMFLAGPTGVGKTELAKTITELLFGDERAYIRFDMSEFSAEHADQRLLGAPPGYVGYDAGGELTTAIRERPFSIVLFDEIEKAHPRILDKFLQILDDGVLTSGRGERVYFSESVIVFTSNLGIYRIDADGERVPNVLPDEPYENVERKVRDEIEKYFKVQLNRPELLNRIGENIVVFDFIRPPVAEQIYEKMVANILDRLADTQQIRISLPPAVNAALREQCIRDLSNGGRGIGNQLEAWLVNPLARALFDQNFPAGSALTVNSIGLVAGVPTAEVG
jgi:hypothetical protein